MVSQNGRRSLLDIVLESTSQESIPSDVEQLLKDRFEDFQRTCVDRDDSTPSLAITHSRQHRRWTNVGHAAFVSCAALVLVALLATSLLSPQLTLAQVEAAVTKQAWIHIQYDNGEETWLSPKQGLVYQKRADGRVVFEDRINKLELKYRPETPQIVEIDYSGIPDDELPESKRDWNKGDFTDLLNRLDSESRKARGPNQDYVVEQHDEVEDERKVVRFDRFLLRDAQEKQLVFQIWIDSETRLPIRRRKPTSANPRALPAGELTFVEGNYEYPQRGPESIYELGVPRESKIVRINAEGRKPRVELAGGVREIIAATRAARDRFPARYRLVMWPADTDSSRSGAGVLYWDGKPNSVKSGFRGQVLDWSEMRIHLKGFSVRDPDPPLQLPATVAETLEWMDSVEPRHLEIADGKGTAHYILSRSSSRPPRAQVMPIQTVGLSQPPFSMDYWPWSFQWSVIGTAKGREDAVSVLEDPPDDVPGTVALRIDMTKDQRMDFYIDPRRDCICRKRVTWKRGTEWHVHKIDELSDLQMLPSGQWFASKKRLRMLARRGYARELNIDIRLVADGDSPNGIFDPTEVLDVAKALKKAERE
jgi:hypothetical protein